MPPNLFICILHTEYLLNNLLFNNKKYIKEENMANGNLPYFSIGAKKAAIKSHNSKESAIKAAGSQGYIFDKMLDIQMIVVKNDDGKLETDFSPDNSFNFKEKLLKESILRTHF